jgi:hypothetical protein
MKMLILVLLLSIFPCRAELPKNFLHAINQVETSGRKGAVTGDNGEALGPFQIHYDYWKDSGIKGAYKQCSDYNYSVRVVTAYMTRYAKKAVESNDYQTLARVHNAGPIALKNKKIALDYWRKVRQFI